MEWGTFLTVITTCYLAYYGFVFLLDLLAKGKTSSVVGEGVHYNMDHLLADEEASQQVNSASYFEPTVAVFDTAAPLEEEFFEEEEEQWQDQEPESEETSSSDGTSNWEESEEEPEPEHTEEVKMAVMGEPMQPASFLKMIREQAMQNALSKSKTIFG